MRLSDSFDLRRWVGSPAVFLGGKQILRCMHGVPIFYYFEVVVFLLDMVLGSWGHAPGGLTLDLWLWRFGMWDNHGLLGPISTGLRCEGMCVDVV